MREKERPWCPEYITTSFVAERCSVSAVTVLSWIEEKRLPAFRLPKGHYRIHRDDFLKFSARYKITISREVKEK